MTPERYQRINVLADAVLDLPPAERAAYLDRACGSDPHLREQVQHLVDAHSTDDDFLEAPALELLAKDLAGASAPHELGGRQIRHYRVISRLGAGGIGEVWLARDTQLTREVALKLLSPQFAGDPYHVRRFRLEARAASTLNHPNIVTIYEIGRTDGVDFIAQEFVQGETLRQRLAKGRIELREVLKIGVQITSALEAAHKAGIVHRDIKPENVMIRPDGLVKVLDFGLARFIERVPPAGEGESIAQSLATGPGFVLGTVRYMSPEQARGQPVDSRSDLFSLGVLVYEMATNVAPFSGPTPADVLAAILTSEPPPASRHVPDIPPEFDRLLRRCLEKDPPARYATAADLGAEMGILARSLESHGAVEFPVMANRRPSRRWMFGGAAAVLAFLMLAWFALFVRKAPNTAGPLQIEQLNLGGDAAGATISPDGKYAAYILNEPGGQSIWNMQLATASRIRLMPPERGAHSGLAFSADGSFLYFMRRQGAEANTLYRLTMLGGQPVKLLENVGEACSVSADGKRVAFVRMDRPRGESALMVGGFDGASVHPLAVRHLPQYFSLYGVAWSPDQRSIAAFAGENAASAQQFHLVQVRLSDGSVRPIGKHTWRWVLNLAWPAKGNALAFVATEQLANYQIWTAPVWGGEATRITNDVSDYSGLSATADGRTLLALQTQMFADLWVAPARDSNAAVQITSGPIHEFNTLAWTPDGRIIYSALVGDDGEIWITDADGRNLRQLANGPGDKNEVAVSRDQRYIFYQSLGHIWRMDFDGGNARQLTHGILEVHPDPAPDGLSVLYASFNDWSPGLGGKPAIWKVPVDGGDPVQVSDEPLSIPRISPDGKWIACPYFPDWRTGRSPRIAAVLDSTGRLRKTFDHLPDGPVFYVWMPLGDAFGYDVDVNGVSNIWRQSLSGGAPGPITHFNRDEIFDFAWSRDGRLALARGRQVSGVVLLRSGGKL